MNPPLQFLPVALPIMVTLVATISIAQWSQNKRFEDLNSRPDDLTSDMNRRSDGLNKRFDELKTDMNRRFDEVISRLDRIEEKLDNHEERIVRLEERTSPVLGG